MRIFSKTGLAAFLFAMGLLRLIAAPTAPADTHETPTSPDWGEADATGVEMRLQATKRVWQSNETPLLKLDLRNTGSEEVTYFGLPQECMLEVDGHWYIWSNPLPIHSPPQSLEPASKPGSEADGTVSFVLSDIWHHSPALDAPDWKNGMGGGETTYLKLSPGKYTVRVKFRAAGHTTITAISNPVEIEEVAATAASKSASSQGATEAWQLARNHQPTALHLKLTLPKKEFYPGEVIEAGLDLSSDDEKTHLYIFEHGIDDKSFHATDEKGGEVVDPFAWLGRGASRNFRLTSEAQRWDQVQTFSTGVEVNQYLRFDHPGVYTIYAEVGVAAGASDAVIDRWNEKKDLVSDTTTITILPLPPEKEKALIAAALKKIETDDYGFAHDIAEGTSVLNDLQTPAARDALIGLLARPKLVRSVEPGLLSAPDPQAVADEIMEQVRSGKLVLDGSGAGLYGTLNAYGVVFDASLTGVTPEMALEREKDLERFQNEVQKQERVEEWKLQDDERAWEKLRAAGGERILTVQARATWEVLRAAQPKALHLTMSLPKKEFVQGEEIKVVTEFSNDNESDPYVVQVGQGAPGAVFHAVDEQGTVAVNPLGWCQGVFEPPLSRRGPQSEIFGDFTLSVPVNDSVRFDHPGVYQLYATAKVGKRPGPLGVVDKSAVVLTSNLETVTILPRSPEKEKEMLEDAGTKIGNTENLTAVEEGIRDLGYLQTPEATDGLIALLGRPEMEGYWNEVERALFSARNPSEAAGRIYQQVQAGKLVLDDRGATIFAELQSAGQICIDEAETGDGWNLANDKDIEFRLPHDKERILQEQIAASGGDGPACVKADWVMFTDVSKNYLEDEDHDGGKARAALAKHQLELPPDEVKQLLSCWYNLGSPDFLPLVRREAKPPADNFDALMILAELKPDEAKPAIIKELHQPEPRFFNWQNVQYPEHAMPLPEFDALFRWYLATKKEAAVPLIESFGSPALLPDVLAYYHKEKFKSKDLEDSLKQISLNLYWMRCDPKVGVAALEKEIDTDQEQGGQTLEIAFSPWREEGLPVVEWALKSSQPGVVGEAVDLLSRHAAESEIEPVIAALERLKSAKIVGAQGDRSSYAFVADKLLKSSRWHYSDEQRKRLGAMVE